MLDVGVSFTCGLHAGAGVAGYSRGRAVEPGVDEASSRSSADSQRSRSCMRAPPRLQCRHRRSVITWGKKEDNKNNNSSRTRHQRRRAVKRDKKQHHNGITSSGSSKHLRNGYGSMAE